MVGSGTTLVEALLTNRRGIGLDIDPLAVMLASAKTTGLDAKAIQAEGQRMLTAAKRMLREKPEALAKVFRQEWDADTQEFVDYWFAEDTQIELMALASLIRAIKDEKIRTFLKLVFSAIIITKSGGVSLAFDLAHTRPHRAKVVFSPEGKLVLGEDPAANPSPRIRLLTKTLRSPLVEFEKRLNANIESIIPPIFPNIRPLVLFADAQAMPLAGSSVDLIVTSPPYAANAIDYMRAHKFSLVWFGQSVDKLSAKRKEYIGAESTGDIKYEVLPPHTTAIIDRLAALDSRKAKVLHRYYSEMTRVLREMHRVLKPGKAAIVVVGSSTMRGVDTETQLCLAEIGRTIGFEEPIIAVRDLDRDRRMMPSGHTVDDDSQIQKRMHQEYVLGLRKPLRRNVPYVDTIPAITQVNVI